MRSRSAFYLYGVLTGVAAVMVLGIDLDFKPPAENLLKDIKILIRNVELVIFFVINFMSGIYQAPMCATRSIFIGCFVEALSLESFRCVLGLH